MNLFKYIIIILQNVLRNKALFLFSSLIPVSENAIGDQSRNAGTDRSDNSKNHKIRRIARPVSLTDRDHGRRNQRYSRRIQH